jgi:hypothetical protein
MYISPSSPFAGAKMSASALPRKITDFARLGEKITGKISDFAILWSFTFVLCVVARDIYCRYVELQN